MQIPDFEYSKGQLIIRAVVVFFITIFLFFATGTEIMDVTKAYMGIELSPRMALIIAALAYGVVIMVFSVATSPEDILSKSGGPAAQVGAIFFVFMMLLVNETELGSSFLMFVGLENEHGSLSNFTPIMTGIFIVYAAAYTAVEDYWRHHSQAIIENETE